MIEKTPLLSNRVRKITGSFAFIQHRFLRDGFWESLTHPELLLYFFLVLVSDRNGLSFYSYDKICALLQMGVEDYIRARNALIEKDLIAFDGHLFQVLSLPSRPVLATPRLLKTPQDMLQRDPATIHQCLCEALGKDPDESIPTSPR